MIEGFDTGEPEADPGGVLPAMTNEAFFQLALAEGQSALIWDFATKRYVHIIHQPAPVCAFQHLVLTLNGGLLS